MGKCRNSVGLSEIWEILHESSSPPLVPYDLHGHQGEKLRIQVHVSPGLVAGMCRIESPIGYFHKLLSLLPHPSSKTPVFPLLCDR